MSPPVAVSKDHHFRDKCPYPLLVGDLPWEKTSLVSSMTTQKVSPWLLQTSVTPPWTHTLVRRYIHPSDRLYLLRVQSSMQPVQRKNKPLSSDSFVPFLNTPIRLRPERGTSLQSRADRERCVRFQFMKQRLMVLLCLSQRCRMSNNCCCASWKVSSDEAHFWSTEGQMFTPPPQTHTAHTTHISCFPQPSTCFQPPVAFFYSADERAFFFH